MLDEPVFRAMYAEHTPALYLLALRLTGNRSDADDVVQETWVRAARHDDRLHAARSQRAWLAAILINCSREQRRGRRTEALADEATHEPSHGTRLDLESALRALPDGFREVLVLHDVEGHTHEEIASLLGIDSGTSRSQLSRARGRLRQNLEGYRER